MLKDLTKKNNRVASATKSPNSSYSKNNNSFLAHKAEQIANDIVNKKCQLENRKLQDKNNNSSFINDKTDVSLKLPSNRRKANQNKEMKFSKYNENLSNSITYNKGKSLTRTDSKFFISNDKSTRRSVSPAMSLLNSRTSIDEKRMKKIKNQCHMSFDENVKTLEILINDIKTKGFQKCREEIESKSKIKKNLENTVENLQKKVNFIRSQKKNYGTKNTKFESEMRMYKDLADRWQRETFFMDKEIPILKSEILDINRIYGENVRETKLIINIINEEEAECEYMREEIRKLNKKISDLEKEKENIRAGKKLLRKHIDNLKEKIEIENVKCKEFITNVSSFADKSIY